MVTLSTTVKQAVNEALRVLFWLCPSALCETCLHSKMPMTSIDIAIYSRQQEMGYKAIKLLQRY